MDSAAAVVFMLVAAGTLAAGLRLSAWRSRALARLAPRRTATAPLPSAAMVWRELVNRIGSTVPASGRDLGQTKRRLIRAGFRDPSAARLFQGARAGLAAASGVAAIAAVWQAGLNMLLIPAAAMAGYMAPGQYLLFRIARRKRAIERGLPNALDLLVVCVESGLGMDQAMIQVAKELHEAHPEICDEFAVMNLELRAGKRRAEALHNLADRTGVEDMKKLVAVLVQTDRFGTSIAQSLRGHADYLRALARQRAEERASKLAVKLVFPIFFCVLPSLFIVTVGPVMTRLIRDLLPMIENL
ncbi:MAG TPA: type II secretion system F family protein [Limnochordia bacterium]